MSVGSSDSDVSLAFLAACFRGISGVCSGYPRRRYGYCNGLGQKKLGFF